MPDKQHSILFVWDNLTEYGGVRTFLMNCMQFLPDRGYAPKLLDLHDGPVVFDEEARAHASEIKHLRRSHWDSERSFEKNLFHWLKQLEPSMVVFVEWRHAEDVMRCVPRDVPVINLCLVDRPDDLYYDFARQHIERVSLILGNSYSITGRLREVLDKKYHDKVSELFIGVQVSGNWHADIRKEEPLRIIYMSRLNQEQKRARDLVPFCQGIKTAGIPFHMTIVGDGDERNYIERELREYISDGTVEMTGSLPFPEAMNRFNDQDIFVLLSAYEGMPLVLLHALAAGVVPVVTDVESGVSELLDDGENAFLFPIGEPEAAVDLVSSLDKDRDMLLRYRTAARALGERHSIRVTMVEFEKRLQQILHYELPPELWQQFSLPEPLGDSWRARLSHRLPRRILRWIGPGI